MAITTTNSDQLTDGYRKYPIDDHGKLRMQYAKATQGAAAGDDGSFMNLFKLPPGRKRIIPWLSRYKVSALGSSRVMKVGHAAYQARSAPNAQEAADDDAFMSAIDVSANVVAFWPLVYASPMKFDIFSSDEVLIYLTITGGTIPAAAVFEFWMAYIYE